MRLLTSLRNALVEEIHTENTLYAAADSFCQDYDNYYDDFYEAEEMALTAVSAGAEAVSSGTLIDDIYIRNGIDDRSQSIFKVEELIHSLPREMVTDTKRITVLSILQSFGLTAAGMAADGEERMKVLNGVLTRLLAEDARTLADKNKQIEQHKQEIARLEREIADNQSAVKEAEASINTELVTISQLISFVEGV